MKILMFLLEIISIPLYPLFALLYFIIRKLNKKSTAGFKIKSGFFEVPFKKEDKIIMFHGVSVGEVIALENLVKLAKTSFPNYKIMITTGTETGQEIAKKKYAGIADFVTYFPFDIPFCVKNFYKKIKPEIVLIAETELWPTFAYYTKKENIPLLIINGRISDDSFNSYKLFKFFFSQVFKFYTGIYTQSEEDLNKMAKIGAPLEKLEVMKNLKFDIKKNTEPVNFEKGNNRVLIAGSTHKGEDEIVLCAYKNLKENFSSLKLLLAPRHLTRVDDIKKIIESFNLKFGLRSKKENFEENDVIILDTLGELSRMYSTADIAFIGGSFNQTGGHNPLEAVIYSKPVISGPSIKNFKDIYWILTRSNAAYVAKTGKDMQKYIQKLLEDNEFYKKASSDCANVFENQKGAKDFVIDKMKKFISA